MTATGSTHTELPNLIGILADKFPKAAIFKLVLIWEYLVYSLIIVVILTVTAYFASRKREMIPQGLQNAAEAFVGALDDFVCGIIGPQGRRFTPFIGTLFVYILFMNLLGLVPFFKAPSASWSTTFALAICVFFYVQYAALRELGFLGYLDHLAGKPRGVMAFTLIMPLFMLVLHIISELIKPVSLSLRLRGNIWGDEVLIGLLASFGISGLPLLLFNMLMAVLTAVVQALVFSLLSTIYFALVLAHEEEHI